MITVLREQGFRVVIYKNDHLPPHVHVYYQAGEARIDISDDQAGRPRLMSAGGYKVADLRRARDISRRRARICSNSGPGYMADLIDDDDLELEAALRRGALERMQRPIPLSVAYDSPSGDIVIRFANGTMFAVPARALQDLETASDADLAEVALLGETGLHWETLDVDFSIAGLMQGVFGTARFMAARREAVSGS